MFQMHPYSNKENKWIELPIQHAIKGLLINVIQVCKNRNASKRHRTVDPWLSHHLKQKEFG